MKRIENITMITEDIYFENKVIQKNILLDIISEVCVDPKSNLPSRLVKKVNKIIDDCDLAQFSSLHKINTSNESSSVLGLMHRTDTVLTYDERCALNQALINKIQYKMPRYLAELGRLRQTIGSGKKSRMPEIKQLEDGLEEKLSRLNAQEEDKIELMMAWLNHRLQEVSEYNKSSYELLTLKTRILELKSQILHLQILRNVFTETNYTLKAYRELHKDLKDNIKETQHNIKDFNAIIDEDYK